jgi:hypothetical protein
MIGAMLIAVLVMPSALNVPPNPPSETLEYAPVPPEDEDDPPPNPGNLSSLGLTGSAGAEGDGAQGGGPSTLPDLISDGVGEVLSDKRCVGNKQTEDPLSPPCVPYFDPEADNFGATYQGVTEDEIKILIYTDGNIRYLGTSRGAEDAPASKYFDLVNDPPKPDEHAVVRMMRSWQKYFNERYQTYGRYVHFYVYFSAADKSPEARRADAADNFKRVQPFATISAAAFNGGGDAYLDSTAKRSVLNFGSFLGQEAQFFERYPKLIWGFMPSLEIQAQQYADVLCEKYVNRPVDHSPQFNGQQRKYGLYFTTDPGYDAARRFKDSVMRKFKDCGGTVAIEQTFPKAGYSVDNSNTPRYATNAALAFRQANVTTIIWPGGLEAKMSIAAANLGYFPEVIAAGDGKLDDEYANATQNQTFWDNVVVVSPAALTPALAQDEICFQALRSVNPGAPRQDVGAIACDYYNDLRQLFIGIQVAGPRLGPTSVDKGFHAIPAIRSSDLRVPACYYLPGDYTCTKDYFIGSWDSAARPDDPQTPGCYRVAASTRYLLGEVPPGNATAQMRPDDPCNNLANSQQLDPNPPDAGNL